MRVSGFICLLFQQQQIYIHSFQIEMREDKKYNDMSFGSPATRTNQVWSSSRIGYLHFIRIIKIKKEQKLNNKKYTKTYMGMSG